MWPDQVRLLEKSEKLETFAVSQIEGHWDADGTQMIGRSEGRLVIRTLRVSETPWGSMRNCRVPVADCSFDCDTLRLVTPKQHDVPNPDVGHVRLPRTHAFAALGPRLLERAGPIRIGALVSALMATPTDDARQSISGSV
jgi:hypothetical protein